MLDSPRRRALPALPERLVLPGRSDTLKATTVGCNSCLRPSRRRRARSDSSPPRPGTASAVLMAETDRSTVALPLLPPSRSSRCRSRQRSVPLLPLFLRRNPLMLCDQSKPSFFTQAGASRSSRPAAVGVFPGKLQRRHSRCPRHPPQRPRPFHRSLHPLFAHCSPPHAPAQLANLFPVLTVHPRLANCANDFALENRSPISMSHRVCPRQPF